MADGQACVQASGTTVRQVLDELGDRFPALRAKLVDSAGDRLARGTAVTVDGITSESGLLEKVQPDSEVHFLPAIAGGTGGVTCE